MKKFASFSLAPATFKSYKTGNDAFLQFCSESEVWKLGPIYPTNENILCYFATHLAQTVQYNTIKIYLAAIKHTHLLKNMELPLQKFSRLQYLLRGIKRYQGHKDYIRKPITPKHLEQFLHQLQPYSQGNFDSKMIWAAICLAFFGFMRISEFTCDGPFNPQENMSSNDICFLPSSTSPSCMKVALKASKTDPFRQGISLTIGATNSIFCPVKAVLNYLDALPSPNNTGPLFQYRSGKNLTRSLFTKEIRNLLSNAGYKAEDYAGHSFRIGAATAAANANLPPWLIKTLGRWASDCFERYIRTPDETLINAAQQLISA